MKSAPVHRVDTHQDGVGRAVLMTDGNHAWEKCPGRPCPMLFALVDGADESAIASPIAEG